MCKIITHEPRLSWQRCIDALYSVASLLNWLILARAIILHATECFLYFGLFFLIAYFRQQFWSRSHGRLFAQRLIFFKSFLIWFDLFDFISSTSNFFLLLLDFKTFFLYFLYCIYLFKIISTFLWFCFSRKKLNKM